MQQIFDDETSQTLVFNITVHSNIRVPRAVYSELIILNNIICVMMYENSRNDLLAAIAVTQLNWQMNCLTELIAQSHII